MKITPELEVIVVKHETLGEIIELSSKFYKDGSKAFVLDDDGVTIRLRKTTATKLAKFLGKVTPKRKTK